AAAKRVGTPSASGCDAAERGREIATGLTLLAMRAPAALAIACVKLIVTSNATPPITLCLQPGEYGSLGGVLLHCKRVFLTLSADGSLFPPPKAHFCDSHHSRRQTPSEDGSYSKGRIAMDAELFFGLRLHLDSGGDVGCPGESKHSGIHS